MTAQINAKIPEDVKQVMNTLISNGYEAYVVGGAVRDCIMRNTPHDWDIATNAQPGHTRLLFDRTIDTGLKHGTVVAMVNGEGYEITTYRIDGDYSDGRHPDSVEFASHIEDDLSRRDFTMNAMAMDINGNIVDPFDGIEDIEKKIIRCVGDPDRRFAEDALRMLRAVRFEAKFGFTLANNIRVSIANNARNLCNVSHERIEDDLTKVLLTKGLRQGFMDAYKCGITKVVLPEFDTMMDVYLKGPGTSESIGEHSLMVAEKVDANLVCRWAALLHDMGLVLSPNTGESPNIHAARSAGMAESILHRLRFSNKDSSDIIDIIRHHEDRNMEMADVRYFVASRDSKLLGNFINLIRNDTVVHSRNKPIADMKTIADPCRKLMHDIYLCMKDGTAISKRDLVIDGKQLTEVGLEGKEIGEFNEIAYRACLENPEFNNRQVLTAMAEAFLKGKRTLTEAVRTGDEPVYIDDGDER